MKLNAQSLDTWSLQTAKSANKTSQIRYYLLTNGARFNAIFRNNQMNSVSRRNFVTHLHSFKLLRKLNFNWFFRSPRVTPWIITVLLLQSLRLGPRAQNKSEEREVLEFYQNEQGRQSKENKGILDISSYPLFGWPFGDTTICNILLCALF